MNKDLIPSWDPGISIKDTIYYGLKYNVDTSNKTWIDRASILLSIQKFNLLNLNFCYNHRLGEWSIYWVTIEG